MSTQNPEQQIDRLTETLERERRANACSALAVELVHRGTPQDRAEQLAADAVNTTLHKFLDTGEAEFILPGGRLVRGRPAIRELATDIRVRDAGADEAARTQKILEQKRRSGTYSGF